MTTLGRLERNDASSASQVWLSLKANGQLTPETAEILIMLQDDPADLIRLVSETAPTR